MTKKIISFSLYGTEKKYCNGAVDNARLSKTLYPDWIPRFYIGDDVPDKVINKIMAENCDAEIVRMHGASCNWTGTFWRFLAYDDCNVMISRDVDSRLNSREVEAVYEWVDSSYGAHIMRDHPFHFMPIMAGMFGLKKGVISSMYELIDDYDVVNDKTCDQVFLQERLFPLLVNNVLIHDEISPLHLLNDAQKFPSSRNSLSFVGEVIDGSGCRNITDLTPLEFVISNFNLYVKDVCELIFEYYDGDKTKKSPLAKAFPKKILRSFFKA